MFQNKQEEKRTNKGRMFVGEVIVFCLFFVLFGAAFAHGQNIGSVNSQTIPVTVPDHPMHASQHNIAVEQSLLNTGGVTTVSGERKASDFSVKSEEVSLGRVAREFRKEEGRKTLLDK